MGCLGTSAGRTGHSLGGGLATLAAKDITLRCPEVPAVTMYSYGGAICGNAAFKEEYDKLVTASAEAFEFSPQRFPDEARVGGLRED